MRAIPLLTPRLTIIQMMKVVVYCAAAMACVAPMVHMTEVSGGLNGPIGPIGPIGRVGLWSAITVPLAWAGVSFLLVRPGKIRDRLILAFLTGPVGIVLALGAWLLWPHAMVFFRGWQTRPIIALAADLGGFVLHVGIILMLGMALVFLVGRLARGQRMTPEERDKP